MTVGGLHSQYLGGAFIQMCFTVEGTDGFNLSLTPSLA